MHTDVLCSNKIYVNKIIETHEDTFFENVFPRKRDVESNAQKRILEVESQNE